MVILFLHLSMVYISLQRKNMSQNDTSTKIGLYTATIIGMNAMIGSGIFTAPAILASNVGPAGILAYIFVVIAVWFMALSLARLAELYPQEGSFYTYAKQWGGHWVGLIAGFLYIIGLFIAMGLLCQMIGKYLYELFPIATDQTWGLITLCALIILNMIGVSLSQLGQKILIVTTLFPLITTTIICLLNGSIANLQPFAPFGYTNVIKATREVIFGFFGFECAASLFPIVQNAQKNVPRALTYSIILVGIIYVSFISSIIFSTPIDYFSNPHILLPDILKRVFPSQPWLITIIHVSIVSAMIGTVHSMIWSSSALLVSLMKKILPQYTIPQKHTHAISVFIVGICIFTSYVSLHNINMFFNLTAVCIVSAYLLSMFTLFTIPAEWKTGNNIKTILGYLTGSIILYFALEGIITNW